MPLQYPNWHFNVQWKIVLFFALAAVSVYALFFSAGLRPSDSAQHVIPTSPSSQPGQQASAPPQLNLVKPADLKIIAMVFFGRRDRCQILHCFLMRNLVDQGGWLDEVHWIRNTDNPQDLEYLDQILSHSARYKQFPQDKTGDQGYGEAWSRLEPGRIYVKIDDDVVWMADDAIPRIVTTKLQHPEYLLVSANMINSPLLGWLHYHMGAMHPYLPEFRPDNDTSTPTSGPEEEKVSSAVDARQPLDSSVARVSWKYSDHPLWQGPDDFTWAHDQKPPRQAHRWLRLAETAATHNNQTHRTPIVSSVYETWGNGLKSWSIAAQQHYSFLENLLDGRLDRYKFASTAGAWLTDYDRLSINFIAVNSTEILAHLPIPADVVDEEWLTVTLPKAIGKSVAVDTQALAAHFAFFFQGELTSTDVLGRYLDFAQENVCQNG